MLTFCIFSGEKLSKMSSSTSQKSKSGSEIAPVTEYINLTSSDSEGTTKSM